MAKYSTGTKYYFCATPECNSRTEPKLTYGKLAICWRCGEPFQMTPRSYQMDKPHCEGCTISRKTKLRKADEPSIVDQIGIQIPDNPSEAVTFADKRKSLFGRRTEDMGSAGAIASSVTTNLRERLAALTGEIEVQPEDPIENLEELLSTEVEDPEL